MAVFETHPATIRTYTMQSTDQKPIPGQLGADGITVDMPHLPEGSTLFVTDTGEHFMWLGRAWEPIVDEVAAAVSAGPQVEVSEDDDEPQEVTVINSLEFEGKLHDTGVFVVPGIVQAAAYSIGDAMGTEFVLNVPKHGIIQTISVIDKDSEELQFDIVMFSEGDPDAPFVADNAAYDFHDERSIHFVGKITVTAADYITFNDNSVASLNPQQAYHTPSGQLYCRLVTRGVPNYTAATDLSLRIFIIE